MSRIINFPVFFSYLRNIFFWVFLVEAFMFLGQIIIVYAWYNVWDKLAYRKVLHVTFGMIAGFFVVTLYLRATATGFEWGRASRWSQYALMACAVTVMLTMVTMGYTRETARRVDNDPGYLIYNCVTLEQELTPPETCPAGDTIAGRQ